MKKAILATLSYADIFNYPLTKQEIWEWLILEDGGQSAKGGDFNHTLNSLLTSGTVISKKKFYFLPEREKIVAIRKKREGWSGYKIQKAEKVAKFLRFIPWIKLVGITGALARKNASRDDDIDLFFIVAANRLWLTRLVVVLSLYFLGLYRRPNKIRDMFCPNMWVTEDCLSIWPQDLFTAHEICLLKTVVNKDKTYQKFLVANSWVEDFLPNITKEAGISRERTIKKERRENGLDLLEKLARSLQLWFMVRRRTKETISDTLLKFHPNDVREKILQEFKTRMEGYQGIC